MLKLWKAGPTSVPPPQPRHFYRDLTENDNLDEYVDFLESEGVKLEIRNDLEADMWSVVSTEEEMFRRQTIHHADKTFAIAAAIQSHWLIRAIRAESARRRAERNRDGK